MGGAIILADPPRGMNPQSIWSMVERERARFLTVVGDAFGRPLLETFRSCRYDASSLRAILNGGAAMSPDVKRGLHEAFDGKVAITDGVGSTEGGIQARTRWTGSEQPATFAAAAQTRLLNAAKTAVLQPGDGEIGWLATAGRVPLGYLGEQQRTRETFPVIDGARCAVPGDRARWIDAERIELLGRDSTTINSGGEKIFSEEVERALLRHCSVREAIVVGRPSLRWGEEAIALVALHPGFALDQAAILASAGEALARYKLPKAILRVDEVRKTAVGKPDLVWARGLAAQGGPHAHDRP
jgi:acyl-CoA synthetase (AMP-forming)/AMP-acid ligase II